MTLTFEEAVFGTEKEIEVPRQEGCTVCGGNGVEPGTSPIRCPECNGTGEIRRQAGFFINIGTCSRCQGRGEIITSPCQECRGQGRIVKTRRLSVKVPAGVDNGTQIRLSGEGESGTLGGPPGNLYVVMRVKPHEYFRRAEDTVHLDLVVNITQAALGDEVSVPTLDGDDMITIPAGTQTGDSIRMKGKGVPRLRRDGTSNSRGDQIVTIEVRTPTNLTREQRDLLLELGKTLDREVVPQREKGFFDRLRDAFGV
jgi:molecular chaperone DnaJ